MTNHLDMSDNTLEQDLLRRYRIRLNNVFREPNPYYKKGEFPTEYQELKQWITQLEKELKNIPAKLFIPKKAYISVREEELTKLQPLNS